MAEIKASKRKQYGDRTFTNKDLWRIYCNNLSVEEMLTFRRQFLKSKGNCQKDFDPCEDLNDLYENGTEAIDTIEDAIEDVSDLIDDTVKDVEGLVSNLSGEIINIFNSEANQSVLDDQLALLEPNPVDRELVAKALSDVFVSFAIAGFAREGFVGDLVGVKVEQHLVTRGKLVTSLSKSVKIALGTLLATAVTFKGLYEVYIKTCDKDK
jgi:hypothetical protein